MFPEMKVSIGELLDKWVILQIKALRIKDEKKLENVITELEYMNDIAGPYMYGPDRSKISELVQQLTEVNEQLWDIEDDIRQLEREGIPTRFFEFMMDENDENWTDKCGCLDDKTETPKVVKFVELARAVYFTNDKRCAIKREINELLSSGFVEEKSYEEY
jgi:hypothetical protein